MSNALCLIIAKGLRTGTAIAMKGTQLLIGRGPDCHLRPRSAQIAVHHCGILARNGRFLLCDLNSTTGTYLNDRQVFGKVELLDRDRLRVGPLHFQVAIRARGERPSV